jgi:hypothetical protein
MRVTTRGANIYGIAAIAIMLIMIAAVLFHWVPQAWQWRLFAVALTLFAIRIFLRLVLARQKRLDNDERAEMLKKRADVDEKSGIN